MTSFRQTYSSSIKQQIFTDKSFTDRYIQVFEKLQDQYLITKDSVLELIELFYNENSLFVQLFQSSFLLIFKTYANQGVKFNRYESQQMINAYSELLKLLFVEMINMEIQVQKSSQQQQYFQNFVDFYLTFFAQALTSPKSFIRDFSFTILITSFKVIDEYLQLELLPQTQQQLISSCIYLLVSNFEDYKRMGVQLYVLLRKIKICSQGVEQLFFYLLETHNNFQTRKLIMFQGITLEKPQKIDRLLNRLKDRNPLIASKVFQKLINNKISIKSLSDQQIIKLLFDGFQSSHQEVKNKSIQFFRHQFIKCLTCSETSSQIDIKSENKLSRIESYLRFFNSDGLLLLPQNHLILSIVLNLITQLSFIVPLELIQSQISIILQKISNLTITRNESAFIFCILRQISKKQQTPKFNKRELKKFIQSGDFLPSLDIIIQKIRKMLKNKITWEQVQKYMFVLRIVKILISDFDYSDCVGKRNTLQQLKKLIWEFDNLIQWENLGSQNEEGFSNQPILMRGNQFIQIEIRKVNEYFSHNQDFSSHNLPIITHPLDLLSSAVEIIFQLSIKQACDSEFLLQIMIDDLISSKQLRLQHQTITKMLAKTSYDLSLIDSQKSQSKDVNLQQIKLSQNKLKELQTQISKRLIANQQKIHTNFIKSFLFMAKLSSLQQSKIYPHKQHLKIKVQKYFQHIKNYLYNHQDQSIRSTNYSSNDHTISYCFLPYILIYRYCLQCSENYQSFKKLFYYYAIEQDKILQKQNPKIALIKFLSIRILIELQVAYQLKKQNQSVGIKQSKDGDQKFIEIFIKNVDWLNELKMTHQFQPIFLFQMIIKTIISSSSFLQKSTVFCSLIVITLIQYFHSPCNNLFMKEFMIALENLSQDSQNQAFQLILSAIQCIYAMCCQVTKQIASKSQKQRFLWQIMKILFSYLRIAAQKMGDNHKNRVDVLKDSLNRLLKMLKLLQRILRSQQLFDFMFIFRLRQVFPFLFFNNNDLKIDLTKQQNQLSLTDISIELLAFTKKNISVFLDFLKLRQQPQNFQRKRQFQLFLFDLEEIDESIQQAISKIINEKNFFQDQQTTDHSPNQDFNSNQITHDRMNLQIIHQYEQSLKKNIKIKHIQILKLISNFKKTPLFSQLYQGWFKYHLQKIKTQQNLKIQPQNQTQDEICSTSLIVQKTQQENKTHKQIFDRMGRRKDLIASRKEKLKQQFFEFKASIKKKRYLIIPYEIVQKAQNEVRKSKIYKKNMKFQKSQQHLNQRISISQIQPKMQRFEQQK